MANPQHYYYYYCGMLKDSSSSGSGSTSGTLQSRLRCFASTYHHDVDVAVAQVLLFLAHYYAFHIRGTAGAIKVGAITAGGAIRRAGGAIRAGAGSHGLTPDYVVSEAWGGFRSGM